MANRIHILIADEPIDFRMDNVNGMMEIMNYSGIDELSEDILEPSDVEDSDLECSDYDSWDDIWFAE